MRARALGLALAVVALAGCGDSDDESSGAKPVVGTFVGKLSGTEAYVAVVAGKQNVVAYVCDGRRGIGRLFTGRRSGDAFEARADGDQIEADLSEAGRVSGSVAIGGVEADRFTGQPATGEAGLYRTVLGAGKSDTRLGWVVLPDGSQRGAMTQSGTTTTAPTLRTSSGTFTLSGRTQPATRVTSSGTDASGFQGGFGQFQ